MGGSAPAPENLKSDQYYWESNLSQALEAGKRLGEFPALDKVNKLFSCIFLGVQPVLSVKDMADIHVEHLGVMAYAAHFQWLPERPPLHDLISVRLESTSGRIGEPVRFIHHFNLS